MPSAPIRASSRSDRTGPAADRRAARMAELVAELTGCDTDAALHAVRARRGPEDPLEVVARAMTDLRRPLPDGLRIAGYLRTTDLRLPLRLRSEPGAFASAPSTFGSAASPGERSGGSRVRPARPFAPIPGVDADADRNDQVIDLRDHTARFRRPTSRPGPRRS